MIRKTLYLIVIAVCLDTKIVLSDDYQRLSQQAQTSVTVSAIVSGWMPITGDVSGQVNDPGSGVVAITGDEFINKVKTESARTTVSRRYKHFPFIAMQMDADGLTAAKAYGSTIQLWEDQEFEKTLKDSVGLIDVPQAWISGFTGKGLSVAVIDTGVQADHPFIKDNLIHEACFADTCPNGKNSMVGEGAAAPNSDHGTHVAGIVLGKPTSTGLSGVAPDLGLIAINVFNIETGRTSLGNIMAALDHVLEISKNHPNTIGAVNMSLGRGRQHGGICQHSQMDFISNQFRQAGIPVVVASGNDSNSRAIGMPACINGFISVGATTKKNRVANFSNGGPSLDLLAPGDSILSAGGHPYHSSHKEICSEGNHKYCTYPGTSMAAPHAAAAIALLKQAAPDKSTAELLDVLRKSGNLVKDSRTGNTTPLIDIGQAIKHIAPRNGNTVSEPKPKQEEDEDTKWNAITG